MKHNECFFSYGMAGLCCGLEFYSVENFQEWENFVTEFQKTLCGLQCLDFPPQPFVKVWPKAGRGLIVFGNGPMHRISFMGGSLSSFRHHCKRMVTRRLAAMGSVLPSKYDAELF